MIHRVTISELTKNTITFDVGGVRCTAANHLDPIESEGVVIQGKSYPLELTLVSVGEVAYLPGPDGSFSGRDEIDGLTRVRACGRIMDYMAHDVIRLDGDVTVAVRLRLPQQSTDYRRGSWLAAEGWLEASMPTPDHDEAGLKGSIVE